MKTKFWILILAALLAFCVGSGAWLLLPREGAYVQVWQDGKLLHTLDLGVDRVVQVRTQYGYNRIEVRDGKVSVTEADCPDHYCMDRGFCSDGAPIVCLPNRLVIRFAGDKKTDGVSG